MGKDLVAQLSRAAAEYERAQHTKPKTFLDFVDFENKTAKLPKTIALGIGGWKKCQVTPQRFTCPLMKWTVTYEWHNGAVKAIGLPNQSNTTEPAWVYPQPDPAK